jgi:hypothetical protein
LLQAVQDLNGNAVNGSFNTPNVFYSVPFD